MSQFTSNRTPSQERERIAPVSHPIRDPYTGNVIGYRTTENTIAPEFVSVHVDPLNNPAMYAYQSMQWASALALELDRQMRILRDTVKIQDRALCAADSGIASGIARAKALEAARKRDRAINEAAARSANVGA